MLKFILLVLKALVRMLGPGLLVVAYIQIIYYAIDHNLLIHLGIALGTLVLGLAILYAWAHMQPEETQDKK